MKQKIQQVFSIFSLLIMVTAVAVGNVMAGKTLVEDWSTTPALDNAWGDSYDSDFQAYVSDNSDGKRLHHILRPYSEKAVDPNIQVRNRIIYSTARNVTTLQTKVRIESIGDISQVSEIDYAGAELFGFFYNNTATPSAPIGDVIFIVRFGDRGNGLEVWYYLSRIDDADYNATDYADGTIPAPTGGWQTGVDYTLTVAYDGDRTFAATMVTPTMETTSSGPVTDASLTNLSPATWAGKWLRSRVYLNAPFTGNPDTYQFHASFDDVQIDTGSGLTPYDDFSSDALSNTRWDENYLLMQSTVVNNMLKMGIKIDLADTISSSGLRNRANIPPEYWDKDVFQFDMMLEDTGYTYAARGRAQGGGIVGNGKHTTTQSDGDGGIYMFALVEKQHNTSDTYRIACGSDMNDTSVPEGYRTFQWINAAAQPDTWYTATLTKRGTILQCEVKDTATDQVLLFGSTDALDHNVSSVAPVGRFWELYARSRNAPGDVITYFDNLYAGDSGSLLLNIVPIISNQKE